jgi:hypothetical protein
MRIFKTVQPSLITLQTLAAVFPPSLLDARAANPAGTGPRPAPMRAFPTPRSATSRESRARRGPDDRSASPSPPPRKTRRRPEIGKIPQKPFP